MTPLTDSQTEQRVAAIFGGTHVPPRDLDKSATEEDATQPTDEIENDLANPEVEDADIADPNEDARKEETADRLRAADYTKKTMALAAEKKAFEAQRQAEMADMQELREFRESLSQNEALRNEVVAAWQRHQGAQGQPQSSDSAALRQVVARLNAMEQETQVQREDRFVARLDAEQRAVASEFGMTVEEVQTFTADLIKGERLGFSTPPDAINEILAGRVARARVKTARLDGQKDLVKQIKEGRRAPSVVPSGKTPVKKELSEEAVAKMSENEFRAFLKKEAGKT